MKYIWSLVILLCAGYAITLSAQTKLNSLLGELDKSNKADVVTIEQKIAIEYKSQYKYAKAIEYFEKVLAYAKSNNNKYLIACTHKNISEVYNLNSEYKLALAEERKALEIVSIKDTLNLVEIYDGLAIVFLNLVKYDSAILYAKKALEINTAIKKYSGLATDFVVLGKIETSYGNINASLDYYTKALFFIKKTDNKIYQLEILNNIGDAYSRMNNYALSINIHLESLAISIKENFKKNTAVTYSELAQNYTILGDLNKSLNYLDKAKAIYEEIGLTGGYVVDMYNRYGLVYTSKKEYSRALDYFEKAIAISDVENNISGLAKAYLNAGVAWHFLGKYIPAMNYYQKALAISAQFDDVRNKAYILNNIGEIYRDAPDSVQQGLKINPNEKFKQSIAAFNESLTIANKINSLEVQMTVWENLSTTYELQHDYLNSLSAYKNFVIVKNKIFNDNTKQKINRLEIQNEYNKKEDSIKLEQTVTTNKLLQQQFLNKQQSQNILLQNNKLLLSQQQLDLTNKEKDLQHLAYLKTQADLQTEQLQKSQQEKLLILTKKEKALEAAQVKSLSQENDLNKLKSGQQFIYGFAALGSLLFVGIYMFNRNRHKQAQLKADLAKERAEQQQKEAEFQRSLADVSLSALRSQMNPHFIFNCLNSIKLYTTQNETVAAADYLTKFSKLIRMALENSRSETVTLQAELASLDLYIQMEAMRFKDKLKYSITINENVDSSFIEIPPLLLQPYVENAIWHGLMHKEEGGHIEVNMQQPTHESVLVITIQDDGVGRQQAALLSGKTNNIHKSYGTKVTAERLALINQVYKTAASVTTTDVKDNAGAVAGTLVTIKIPFE